MIHRQPRATSLRKIAPLLLATTAALVIAAAIGARTLAQQAAASDLTTEQSRLAALAQDLLAQGNTAEAYQAILNLKSAAFFRQPGNDADVRAQANVTIAQLAAALPPDAALVDYVELTRGTERTLLAFVLRAGGANAGQVQMFELGPADPLVAAIDLWRTTYGESAESREAGAMLRTKLWEPLAAAVGDAALVLISPDGALARFPFAALPGSKPDTYLIEDLSLALIPVPQLIPALVTAERMEKLPADLLVLGGVDYDHRAEAEDGASNAVDGLLRPWELPGDDGALRAGRSDHPFSFLAGTDSEAAFVAALYERAMNLPPGTDRIIRLRGAAATEEAFTRFAPTAYLLHLATHAFFDEPPADGQPGAPAIDPGQYAGLVLAGANDPPQADAADAPLDGFLTAAEIAALPLGGAQLVVLSACDSSVGRTFGGERLLSIQRAFQIAGARTTIAAIWPVDDQATRRIMEEFYRNYLQKRMSPLDALRSAQLWALNAPVLIPRGADPPEAAAAKRLPPQYWAAFTLSGDWR